ncbi:transcription factor-like protein [Perilla frutescens var. hirtella]|uniref:Transcription factor-like protein n=1 Tax=Perilla frutescens var. hirtella TaxID=608512 RepID=A0AAD4J8I5_PERFH|nr:transcription factor-like protein [Perilla frutescens var. frutescens]KAH6793016.1 transcription factor-like protein [Perilla frutescens var. hirtella]KAH6829168.1 transcription factor-like protein [Perilla frutescens var. hirtella]
MDHPQTARVEMKFCEFYDKWMGQLEEHLRLLLVAPMQQQQQSGEAEFKCIVNKLTAHHKAYYTFKWAAAHEDVLAIFTPVWLSPLENAYLWITGWKPSTAFRLVESLKAARSESGASLAGLSEEQVGRIEALRLKIKAEEERVEREMERQQVAMADKKMVQLARLDSLAKKNGEAAAVDGLVEVALKGMLAGLERVMKMADCVRLKTIKGVLDVLSPMQCVQFLAATSMLHIQIRKWGNNSNKSSHQI